MNGLFTDRARQALEFALDEAVANGQTSIGPEHLMLGLIREGSGIAAAMLREVCDNAYRLAPAIRQLLIREPDAGKSRKLPMLPSTKDSIELALGECRRLSHNYVGTEHLLLGLLQLPDSPLAGAFASIGVNPQEINRRMLALMGDKSSADDAGQS